MRFPKQEYDFNAWLTTDETEAYDRIVKRRRRSMLARRWLMAAAIIGVVFIIGMRIGKTGWLSSNDKQPEVVVHTTDTLKRQPHLAEAPAQTAPSHQVADSREASKQVAPSQKSKARLSRPTSAQSPSSDSLQYFIAQLERELNRVSDSVTTAHRERILRADARLQQLVRKILIDGLTRDNEQTQEAMNASSPISEP